MQSIVFSKYEFFYVFCGSVISCMKEIKTVEYSDVLLFYYCGLQTKLVGLMDADVYGPSIPKMMNLKGPVQLNKRRILCILL